MRIERASFLKLLKIRVYLQAQIYFSIILALTLTYWMQLSLFNSRTCVNYIMIQQVIKIYLGIQKKKCMKILWQFRIIKVKCKTKSPNVSTLKLCKLYVLTMIRWEHFSEINCPHIYVFCQSLALHSEPQVHGPLAYVAFSHL